MKLSGCMILCRNTRRTKDVARSKSLPKEKYAAAGMSLPTGTDDEDDEDDEDDDDDEEGPSHEKDLISIPAMDNVRSSVRLPSDTNDYNNLEV